MKSESEKLIELVNQFGARNYHPLPIVLRKGSGSRVWDLEGKEYLDFLSCYSALNFGHQNPALVETVRAQMEKIAVCSRAFYSEELCLFSKELAATTGLDMVLPMNSGAEAVETAIKLARKWGYEKKRVAPEKANIIVMEGNFHGRTVALVSFSTEPLYRDGFGPFAPGFKIVPFGDIAAVEKAIDENTVAVLLEPIQAEAGILVPPAGYLKNLKTLCGKNRVLLMLDEIQTGLARTGKNFCFQYELDRPDVVILGKSLGGGILPVSATVATREVMEVIQPGEHGSTFGGNPLACAVGRRVLKMLDEERFAEKALAIGEVVKKVLSDSPLPKVKEIRGRGALIGIEMEKSAGGARKYCEKMAELGVLCKETHEHVIRIAPPLSISQEDLIIGVHKIVKTIQLLAHA